MQKTNSIHTFECNHSDACILQFIGSLTYDETGTIVSDTIDQKTLDVYEFKMTWLEHVKKLTPNGVLIDE